MSGENTDELWLDKNVMMLFTGFGVWINYRKFSIKELYEFGLVSTNPVSCYKTKTLNSKLHSYF